MAVAPDFTSYSYLAWTSKSSLFFKLSEVFDFLDLLSSSNIFFSVLFYIDDTFFYSKNVLSLTFVLFVFIFYVGSN